MENKEISKSSESVCMNPLCWLEKKCIDNCWNFKQCKSYLKNNYTEKKLRKRSEHAS